MLSKPLETWNESDWTWICESNKNLFENVQEHEIFQNSFFLSKMLGLRFVFLNNEVKIILKGVCEL